MLKEIRNDDGWPCAMQRGRALGIDDEITLAGVFGIGSKDESV